MRVLVATSRNPHGHSFLLDHTLVGFHDLLLAGEIDELALWPDAPWLRLKEDPEQPGSAIPAPGQRDDCQIDSDQALDLPQALTGPADLVVGSTHAAAELALAAHGHSGARVALLDGDDHDRDQRNAAPHTHYFKRELPLGATWARPFPFTYPERRIPVWARYNERERRLVYHASDAAGSAGGRLDIVRGCRERLGRMADVGTLDSRTNRLKPEELHERLYDALIGVHWNPYAGAPSNGRWGHGWDGNRFWENCAHGVVNISLRPWIEIPHPFTDGVNVVWVDNPGQVGIRAAELLRPENEEALRKMARASRAHFLRWHSAAERARYVLRECGLRLNTTESMP